MTHKDEIVEEVRKEREAYAAQFNYDLAKMYADLKASEQQRSNIAALQPINPHFEHQVKNAESR